MFYNFVLYFLNKIFRYVYFPIGLFKLKFKNSLLFYFFKFNSNCFLNVYQSNFLDLFTFFFNIDRFRCVKRARNLLNSRKARIKAVYRYSAYRDSSFNCNPLVSCCCYQTFQTRRLIACDVCKRQVQLPVHSQLTKTHTEFLGRRGALAKDARCDSMRRTIQNTAHTFEWLDWMSRRI